MPKPAALNFPEPEDEFDRKLVSDVREYGWHCILVSDNAHPHHAKQNAAQGPDALSDAPFAYTAGLWLTRSHPDLLIAGAWPQAHGLLAAAVDLIDEGEKLGPGAVSTKILANDLPVRFDSIADRDRVRFLTYADWVNRRVPAAALQLVMPDADGRWPDNPEYDSVLQPLLSTEG